MSVKELVIINFALLAVVLPVAVFFIRRKRLSMHLHHKHSLQNNEAQSDMQPSIIDKIAAGQSHSQSSYVKTGRSAKYRQFVEDLENEQAQTSDSATSASNGKLELKKDIQVHFNYNGHTWEAYEVLGVTQYSTLEKITAAYKKAYAQVDPESREFLKAAYDAIIRQK